MCVDYRRINKLQPEVTKADGGKGCISLIPLPKIDELYAKLKGYKVFSSLDLRSGYYHIGLSDSVKPKSAFVLSSLGKYQFNRVPFRLAQAPAYFQKLINDVLKGCNFAMGYLDDIIIYSRTEKEHLEHLEEIFSRLRAAGLKLKLEKCSFFKKHIQYLGHLISADGIQPLPEKLESIAKMPAPKNPKEVKQFLGMVGYYRKFVPRLADISRVLTHLTKKDVEFKWTTECEKCFQILKEFLQQAPILKYPDPQANYTLYTDASKYAYTGILTQHIDGIDHPITYISGLFHGSQLNWATLTKEAYAIYMSVKKLSFYIDTAKITVKSDHLPLKKFLEKNTLNSKVNNWAVELETQDITFKYIPGICNTLADTLSRLIEMDKDIRPPPEEEGKEFGYFPFEELPPVMTQVIEEVIESEIGNINIQHPDPVEINNDISLPLKDNKLMQLQKSDPHTNELRKQWENNNLDRNTYTMENNYTSKAFQPKYKPFCIIGLLGKNQVKVKDNHGHTTKVHRRDVKKIPMMEKICQLYKEEQMVKVREGRKALPSNKMPELGWDIAETHIQTTPGQQETTRTNSQQTPHTLQAMITIAILITAVLEHIKIHIWEIPTIVRTITQMAKGAIRRINNTRFIQNITESHSKARLAVTIANSTTSHTSCITPTANKQQY